VRRLVVRSTGVDGRPVPGCDSANIAITGSADHPDGLTSATATDV
jgi:hypothetical protein